MCFYLLKRKSRLEPTTAARDILKKPSGCKNPSTVLKFAVSSSLYDDAFSIGTRSHPTAGRLERRRRGSARKADSACAARIAPAGALLYEPGTRRPHAANDRASQRGLSTTYRQTQPPWQNRTHFMAVAAQLMRRIMVDHARARHALKRGAGAIRVTLDETAWVTEERAEELLALDEALEKLAEFDRRRCEIVEMRHFGGLTVEEIADVLKVHPNTVMRDWRAAKAWLYAELTTEGC